MGLRSGLFLFWAFCVLTSAPPEADGKDSGDAGVPGLYPRTVSKRPDIASPGKLPDGTEVLVARTKDGQYTLMPVAVTPGASVVPWNQTLEIDREDFPTLARTGLHSEIELDLTQTITDRSIAEITELGRPGRLSSSGFMGEDEDIISVLKGDNRLAEKLGLTHAELAQPLLHLCNMIREMGRFSHQTTQSHTILYHGREVHMDVVLTKGGQKSIFADGIGGAWSIKIRRDLDESEVQFLRARYAHLGAEAKAALIGKLTVIWTGEMQPFYILRYGFYEGHTDWRADPIAIALVFGLRSIEQIEKAFPGEIPEVLTRHCTRVNRY